VTEGLTAAVVARTFAVVVLVRLAFALGFGLRLGGGATRSLDGGSIAMAMCRGRAAAVFLEAAPEPATFTGAIDCAVRASSASGRPGAAAARTSFDVFASWAAAASALRAGSTKRAATTMSKSLYAGHLNLPSCARTASP